MSKRRITKQQSLRINKNQTAYQNTTDETCQPGLVIARFNRHAEIETTEGVIVPCLIRPNIESLVAGDRVIWQPSEDKGVIVSRFERDSVLNRYDTRGQARPIAANVSQIIIVIATKPELSWPLLDSYLVMVETLNLKPLIVLNKIDIPMEVLKGELNARYGNLGYEIIFTSQTDTTGYQQLLTALNNHVSVFVGQSGVGKSSLISRVLPHETAIATAEISSQSELGCHTTRNSRFYHLSGGGALIDSPGVREFKLEHLTKADVVAGFPEFRELATTCKFRNCNHINDAGCAIVPAVNHNRFLAPRYNHMIQFIKQLTPLQ